MSNKIPCGGFYLDDMLNVNDSGELSIKGGTPYQQLVTDGSGNTVWEDRLCYETEPVLTEIVPEETVSFSEHGVMAALWPSNFNPVDGSTYIVRIDGADYTCTCVRVDKGVVFSAIGNLSMIGAGDDTGEPFIIYGTGPNSWEIDSSDSASEHTISIYGLNETIQKIDEKFLPVASDNNYGVVKKSEIVTSYVFGSYAPHDKMVEAVTAFRNGTAIIIWDLHQVSSARYDSSTDELVISFVDRPYVIYRCRNVSGKYSYSLIEKDSLTACETKLLRLFDEDNPNRQSAISASGASQDDMTVNISAEHLSLESMEILNQKELILYSTTVNSTKRFRITVDDSGTISATEVTS